jgi:hypothetical protein
VATRKPRCDKGKSKSEHRFQTIDGVLHRQCTVCEEWKPRDRDHFYASSRSFDGLMGRCIPCFAQAGRESRAKHPETQRAHIDRNKEAKREYDKQYRAANRVRISEWRKQYYLENSDAVKAAVRCHREANPQWALNYRKHKYHANPAYRLGEVHRGRCNKAIKLGGTKKMQSYIKALGCTSVEFRDYIASKFQPGMTWENYGPKGWHIDHVIACAKFDLNDPIQQATCFHYTNMQPLWWFDNLSKGAA